MLTLSSLSIYPLKSCAELPLTQATVEPLGLQQDRRWMAVRSDGSCMTGRELPGFVHLRAVPVPEGLHLSAPGMPELVVSVPPADAPRLDITVWDDTCSAAWIGDDADRWLSAYLREPARLVYVDTRMQRPVDPKYAAPEDRVGFADGFPLLLATEASLADLNTRLPQPVQMNRFRPNLVVSGCEPFAEDRWKRLRIGEVELELVKPCARCVFVNVDTRTARPDPAQQPLRTLATYRKDGNKVMFGQNVIARRTGVLRVGDAVEVLEEA
ncbi:flavodoxin reductase (ferredoxin-NADPH reductase) family 1 [Cystobacter fuscus]|uniref:Flavodoxin reductase (Ferredoxin-NADPH reductase) family 1 n=1 Tax=Cystobacter fuscus TaxID=43 RepID=A0A250JB05_9BACT|nr:MOSC domain-containing protein [Cystobacter fuscus]ATB40748.1 flavodoxin reductase (ferredoxin-NADPH reductase) family 1 [Cystobacter fuscus]